MFEVGGGTIEIGAKVNRGAIELVRADVAEIGAKKAGGVTGVVGASIDMIGRSAGLVEVEERPNRGIVGAS